MTHQIQKQWDAGFHVINIKMDQQAQSKTSRLTSRSHTSMISAVIGRLESHKIGDHERTPFIT